MLSISRYLEATSTQITVEPEARANIAANIANIAGARRKSTCMHVYTYVYIYNNMCIIYVPPKALCIRIHIYKFIHMLKVWSVSRIQSLDSREFTHKCTLLNIVMRKSVTIEHVVESRISLEHVVESRISHMSQSCLTYR